MSTALHSIYGLIERESDTGTFVGKIIGFAHIEFNGKSLAEVEAKVRKAVLDYVASDVLVLQTKFVALVNIDVAGAVPDSAHPGALAGEGRADAARIAAEADVKLQPMLDAFRPELHGGEFPHAESRIEGKIKTFGPAGPPYEVGRPLRQLDNGDWLFEVTMVESGELAEYRLARVVNDPDAY